MKGAIRVSLAIIVSLLGLSIAEGQIPQLLNYQGRISVNGTNFTGNGLFKFALVSQAGNNARTATATATVSFGFLVHVDVIDCGAGYTNAPTVSISGGGGSGAVLSATISGGSVTSVSVVNTGSGYTGTPLITFAAPPANPIANTYWSHDGTSVSGFAPVSAVTLPVMRGLYSVQLGDTSLSNMTVISPTVFTNGDVHLRVWFSDGTNTFQLLTPDQRIAAVGYAMMAASVPDGTITASKLAAGAVGSSQLASNVTINGTLSAGRLVGDGSGLTNVPSSETWATLAAVTNYQTSAGSYLMLEANSSIRLPANPKVGETLRVWPLSPPLQLLQNAGQSVVRQAGVAAFWEGESSSDGGRILMGLFGGGALMSTNAGTSWQLADLPWIPEVVFTVASASDGSKLYVGGDNRLLSSTNFGATWQINSSWPEGINAAACSPEGDKVVIGGSTTISVSTNSGSTWSSATKPVGTDATEMLACSANGTKVYAAFYQGLYVSSNLGNSWTQGTGPGNTYWRALRCSSDGSKAVAVGDAGIYFSANSGSTWTLRPFAPASSGWYTLKASSDLSKIVAITLEGSVYFSTNSGATWTFNSNFPTEQGLWTVTGSSDLTKLVIGEGYPGNIHTSDDSGATWTTRAFPRSSFRSYTVRGTDGYANLLEITQYTFVYLGNGRFLWVNPGVNLLEGH